MPAHFMRFLIISSSRRPIALCSSSFSTFNFISLSTALGCFPHLGWPFQRKTQKQRKKLHRVTFEGPSLPPGAPQHSAHVPKIASPPWESACVCLCVSVCVCVCVYLISICWDTVSSGWPGGWWSVALPSSLRCPPRGDLTTTRAHTGANSHTRTPTQTRVDTCTPPLLGLSAPQASLRLPPC